MKRPDLREPDLLGLPQTKPMCMACRRSGGSNPLSSTGFSDLRSISVGFAVVRMCPLVGVSGRCGARRPDGIFAEALRAVPPCGAGPLAAVLTAC
jgi:hypothetical protein